jgi:Flp pilus assembly secretin CpaC
VIVCDMAPFLNRSRHGKKTAKKLIRRPWTKDDHKTMKTMAKAKVGTAKIAKALKRTPGSIVVMATKVGVSLSMR